jgi:hypothetical protein
MSKPKHKSTREILQQMLVEYNKSVGFRSQLGLIHDLDEQGFLTTYEKKKITEYVRNHPLKVSWVVYHSPEWRQFEIVPNDIWYKIHITELKRLNK